MDYSWGNDWLKLDKNDWMKLLKSPDIFYPENIEMLLYVLACPGHRSTASEMAEVFNVHHNKISSIIRLLSKRILKYYDRIPQPRKYKGYRYWNICFIGDEIYEYDSKNHFWFIIRPELVIALLDIYDIPQNNKRKNNKIDTYREGAISNRTYNVYERNQQARNECISYHGATCSICGFNFKEIYGDVGEGKIHVHHLIPLHTGEGRERVVSPLEDLCPVCANCHFIIHSKFPSYTIEEVKQMVLHSK